MINSTEDLSAIILGSKDISSVDWHKYGQVNVKQKGDLLLFNYMKTCQYKSPEEWNWFEKVSRGLVMSTEGKVVARPFDKFWNFGEVSPPGKVAEITEKVDGSLGICFWFNGAWRVVTRGSFDSEQALWAQRFLYEKYNLKAVQRDITLLFEIIYPDNQVVVDYGDLEDVFLLGVRHTRSGYDWWFSAVKNLANFFGLKTAPVYELEDVDSLIEKAKTLGPKHEGWVVRYENGTRVKVKGATYLELHKWANRFIGNNGFKTVAKAIAEGTIDRLAESCPESIQKEFKESLEAIKVLIGSYWVKVERLYNENPYETRKEFALWAKQQPKHLQKFLFLRYDDKLTDRDIAKYIYELY